MLSSFRQLRKKTINAFLAIWLILGFVLTPVLDTANDLHAMEHAAAVADHDENHGYKDGSAGILAADEGSSTDGWHQLMHSGYTSAQSTAASSEALLVPSIGHVVNIYPPESVSSPAPSRQNLFRPPIA